MLAFFRLVWMRLESTAQYRLDMALWTAMELVTPFISLAVWYAVAVSGDNPILSPTETITYYLLVAFVFTVINSWIGYRLAENIREGDIAKLLVRPLNVFLDYIAEMIAEKTYRLFLPFVIGLSGYVIWQIQTGHNWHALLLLPIFLLSLLLAIIVSAAFDLALGLVAFWFEDVMELRHYSDLLYTVSSGLMIPLAVMPEAVRTAFHFLPFRYMVSAPVEIFMGTVGSTLVLLGLQGVWAVGLVGVIMFLWKKGLKRYAVPGN